MSKHYCFKAEAECELDVDEAYQQGRAGALMEILSPYDVESIEELIENARRKAKADAIDECKEILKVQHMIRTTEDDFSAKIEIPFYRKLWEKFEGLKEQNNG